MKMKCLGTVGFRMFMGTDIFKAEGSKQFEAFLDILGEKIQLQGYIGYAAGLDTKTGLTGTHAYTSTWRQRFQITYHVSTLLPLDRNDSQKIQRKRHIGNGTISLLGANLMQTL